VPLLAKTRRGRLWTYLRDDRHFFYSPDGGGEHAERHLAGYSGLMQADAC
jgi:transposase